MEYKGWNEFEAGSVLFPFEKEGVGMAQKHASDREYRSDSSYKASVAHWRVEKPIFNTEHCINCYFCWVYCPDSSILVRDEKMVGVDYIHCKGCGVCAEVCPTNPKSLLMFNDYETDEVALSKWPAKESKKKDK
ncbi:4Fe-4S dicluster-binding protein [Helicobacter mesocricetorum]|uniref:4Fe-4S dicluster-binding protein n=1 Tax=Helicobacter mesocricetorum TaxID=87012 RepID=UPI000CF17208|nr:4Fe-4S dicluster-binding protein [Helicobacter mesocricetorum]